MTSHEQRMEAFRERLSRPGPPQKSDELNAMIRDLRRRAAAEGWDGKPKPEFIEVPAAVYDAILDHMRAWHEWGNEIGVEQPEFNLPVLFRGVPLKRATQ